MNPNHYLAVAIDYLFSQPAAVAGGAGGREDAGQQLDDRPRRGRRSAGSCVEVPVGFKWFVRRPARRDRSASAARRAPGRASCAATARSGRPTRTASSWTCSRRRSPRRTGKDPGEHYQELTARVRRRPTTSASTRPPRRRRRRRSRSSRPTRSRRLDARRRADRREAHAGAGQRRADRRAQGGDRRTAGSPRAPRAPRTSTRSTPRASRAPTTSRRPRRRGEADRRRRPRQLTKGSEPVVQKLKGAAPTGLRPRRAWRERPRARSRGTSRRRSGSPRTAGRRTGCGCRAGSRSLCSTFGAKPAAVITGPLAAIESAAPTLSASMHRRRVDAFLALAGAPLVEVDHVGEERLARARRRSPSRRPPP